MAEYIDCDAFIAEKRMHYCAACKRRQGMKNGKMQFCYEIGDAPCRACDVADMLDYIEDFPASDVRPVVRGKWVQTGGKYSRDRMIDRRILTCSVCGNFICMEGVNAGRGDANFCPNCGADMREVDNG